MKNYIKSLLPLLAFMFLLSSCSMDNDVKSLTTYTFDYNIDNLPTVRLDASLFEYNKEGKIVAINKIDSCITGTSYIYSSSNNTAYIKVYFTATDKQTSHTKSFWVDQVYYLNQESSIKIDIGNEVIEISGEPYGMIII